ncbi:MAG: hypothetical protein MUC83_13915 [Pirellula sp.]|nr:hypothetical protein [Pirellula sp.]
MLLQFSCLNSSASPIVPNRSQELFVRFDHSANMDDEMEESSDDDADDEESEDDD